MPEEKLPDRISNDKQLVNEGAEKWLNRPIKCLDHGFVYLVDYMGNDAAITQAARVSYGKGTKKVSDDELLIRYLLSHEHGTPFEMCMTKFHARMPIFVARQWVRHRMASINEASGRYSEMSEDCYLPDASQLRSQSKDNKQGRGGELDDIRKAKVLEILTKSYKLQADFYQELLQIGLSRELARIILPVANYTEWYWKADIRNLFHFLELRMESHAQYEIRVYANAMARIVKDAFPLAYGAFENYQLNAVTFSEQELKFLRQMRSRLRMDEEDMEGIAIRFFKNKREAHEFLEKWKSIFK